MTRVFYLILIVLFIFMTLDAIGQVIATIPDTMGKPDSTVLLPVRVDFKSYGIISYYFEIHFNPSVLDIQEVSTLGTLSEIWSNPVVNVNFPGKIILGAFSAGDTLRGKGNLFYLVCQVKGNDSDTTYVKFIDGYVNNGIPSIYKKGGIFTIRQETSVRSAEGVHLPEELVLLPNYPDPFYGVTTISYQLYQKEHVSVKIYDILGREIISMKDHEQLPNTYSLIWDGRDFKGEIVPSGIYHCILTTGNRLSAEKMVFMK